MYQDCIFIFGLMMVRLNRNMLPEFLILITIYIVVLLMGINYYTITVIQDLQVESVINCTVHLSRDQPEDGPTNRVETCHWNYNVIKYKLVSDCIILYILYYILAYGKNFRSWNRCNCLKQWGRNMVSSSLHMLMHLSPPPPPSLWIFPPPPPQVQDCNQS